MTAIGLLRWTARIGSLVSLSFVSAFVIGGQERELPDGNELLGLLCFPIGVLLGQLLGWKLEVTGGSISVMSLLLFYLWSTCLNGRFPTGPYFVLLSLPGLLFLVTGMLTHRVRGVRR